MLKKSSREPEVMLSNSNSLTFRGFHPIKTNKISVKEVQRQAEDTAKSNHLERESRNNSVDSVKINPLKNVSNSIELTRRIINNNIG